MTAPPVFVALTAAGTDLARRLQATFPDSELHGRTGRVAEADVFFAETTAHIAKLFNAGRPLIGICAAGILIRALAPHLADKTAEPPVLALAEDGSAIVPLLGGHSGANRLAQTLGGVLGTLPALTTAGDVRFGLALDDPPPGWSLGGVHGRSQDVSDAGRAAAKHVMAAALDGQPLGLDVIAGDAAWLERSALTFDDTAALRIRVTDEVTPEDGVPGTNVFGADGVPGAEGGLFILHPPSLAVGVGCERDAAPAEVIALIEDTLAQGGLSPRSVACIASIDVKMDEPAVHAAAAHFGVPARFFTAAALEAETPRLKTPSDVVYREVGCHGVAEGAALAAGGPESSLIVPKHKSARATCAVVRAQGNIDPARVGQARGRLSVVGIGPGEANWRTPAVSRAVAEATDLVGYRLYLDLLGEAVQGKTCHDSELSKEEARVRRALELAAEGRDVCLVCSGDAGIYALATLTVELLEHENRPDWNRVALRFEPGVSALQAAAARAGAPLGHDFAAVSLSDLLTPWEVIEKRLRAVAEGDFVLALYNPVSKRRRWQLEKARDVLLDHRPADTPVILARNLGRDGESVEVIDLADLHPDLVDMLTVVLIGASQTRRAICGHRSWVYTPRGYAAKFEATPHGAMETAQREAGE